MGRGGAGLILAGGPFHAGSWEARAPFITWSGANNLEGSLITAGGGCSEHHGGIFRVCAHSWGFSPRP